MEAPVIPVSCRLAAPARLHDAPVRATIPPSGSRWAASARIPRLVACVAFGVAAFRVQGRMGCRRAEAMRRRAGKDGSSGNLPTSEGVVVQATVGEDSVEDQSRSPEETPSRREAVDKWAYFFKRLFVDLGEYIKSPRRDFTYWAIVAFSTVLTFASDFLGSMRYLLSFNPEAAREAGLDQIYEVEGLKSFVQAGRYRLRYPGNWLTDQSVLFAQQAEREQPRFGAKPKIIPDIAFGPEGGGLAPWQQRENLSVIVQPVQNSSSLNELLGDPSQAFDKLVREVLAPPGSGKSIELVSAGQRQSGRALVYEFEYVLVRESKEGLVRIHTWSSVALGRAAKDAAQRPLYTMTIVVPEARLKPERQAVIVSSWKSFTMEA